jgi:hypothetical protein
VAVAAADEGVAVLEPRRAVEAGTDGVFPDDLARVVILAGGVVAFVSDEVVAVGELADETRVAVRVGLADLELDLFEQLAVGVHLDDPPGTALGEHRRLAVGETLERVHLHRLPALPFNFALS